MLLNSLQPHPNPSYATAHLKALSRRGALKVPPITKGRDLGWGWNVRKILKILYFCSILVPLPLEGVVESVFLDTGGGHTPNCQKILPFCVEFNSLRNNPAGSEVNSG